MLLLFFLLLLGLLLVLVALFLFLVLCSLQLFLLLLCVSGGPGILLLCYFFEALLKIEVADVLGGLVSLDAIGEERACVGVLHGVFPGILLYSQFLLLHQQDRHHLYLLQPVDIEHVVFAWWLLDKWRWRVAGGIGFGFRSWLFL
jgi:hypothetical protein